MISAQFTKTYDANDSVLSFKNGKINAVKLKKVRSKMINYTIKNVKLRLFNSIDDVYLYIKSCELDKDNTVILEHQNFNGFLILNNARFFDAVGEITNYLDSDIREKIEEDFLTFIE